jgi:hypothetical protein
MNLERENLKTSLREALQADGGLAVFRHYGFEPSRRPQRQNPFRQERTSSFFVGEKAGKYFFKDFGDDTFKGNAWRFVHARPNTGFRNLVWHLWAYLLAYQALAHSRLAYTKPNKHTPQRI